MVIHQIVFAISVIYRLVFLVQAIPIIAFSASQVIHSLIIYVMTSALLKCFRVIQLKTVQNVMIIVLNAP